MLWTILASFFVYFIPIRDWATGIIRKCKHCKNRFSNMGINDIALLCNDPNMGVVKFISEMYKIVKNNIQPAGHQVKVVKLTCEHVC